MSSAVELCASTNAIQTETNSDSHSDPELPSDHDDADSESTSSHSLRLFFSCLTAIVKEASVMMDLSEDEIIARWMNHKGMLLMTTND